ncbi:AraC family transcriptional regulator [Polaribacter atrinae]|uniref:AraC family transcriptional regulator n=1 Tax=Polaribacter atrinae TaxID=1333662 RepID=UPI0030FB48F1
MKAKFEKIPQSQESSFHAFIYENTHFNAPLHFHPEYELTYIIKGKGIRYVGNSIQNFEEGDFVLLGKKVPHCWKDSDTENNKTVKSIVIQFNETFLGNGWQDKSEFRNIKNLLSSSLKGIKFKKKTSKLFSKKISNLLQKTSLEKLIYFIQLLEDLSKVNKKEFLISEGFTPLLNSKTNNRVDKIYNYVHENYHKKITLKETAFLIGLSEEAFCRFFKKSLQKSFFTYINEYRINVACKQLIESKKTVSEIAFNCGYDSLPFFYRQFKKFKKRTPLNFRKVYSEL